MKKISKYLLLLAAAVFTFTACEKNVEREPSPLDVPGAISFASAGESVELDLNKEPLETSFTLFRTSNIEKADTIKLAVTADPVFKIDSVIIFAPGDKEVTSKVTFPDAEVFGNYSFQLTLPEDQVSPYLQGGTSFAYKVSIVAWSDIKKGVWVDDAGLCSTFGLAAGIAWIVDYQSSVLPKDAGTRVRVINAYKTAATAEDPDTGLPNGYPYAGAPFTINKGQYNFMLDLLADGTALFADDALLGLSYEGYGDMILVNMKANSAGVYDAAAGRATFDAATKFYAFGFYDATAADPYDLWNYAGFRFYVSTEAWLADQKEPVVVDADVTTYEGNWTIKGTDPMDETTPVSANVTVTSYEDPEQGQFYAIEGLFANMPVVYGTFDETTHAFKIEASQGDPVDIGGTTYVPILYMLDANFNPSATITLDIVPGEGGTLVPSAESAAVGFIIVYINPADQTNPQFGEGMFDISFEPANAGAPARKVAAAKRANVKKALFPMSSMDKKIR